MSHANANADRLYWGLLQLTLLLPVAVIVYGFVRGASPRDGARLDDFGRVPDFSLVERSGRAVRSADLAGAPWVADFIYTHCDGSCPLLSAEMARLERRVGDRVRLVSFSVDPERDTPQALRSYAERFGASATGWWFVTGDRAAIRALVGPGFHLALVDPPPGEPALAGTITHSDKIVLVDREQHIRRYYDGGDDQWIADAVADLVELGVSVTGSTS